MDKIAIISDIHGNIPALESVLQDIRERNISRIFCLGDIVGKGPHPEKAVERSRAIIDGAGFDTKLIIGSIRSPEDVNRAAMAGAHIVTIPYKILAQMPYHYHTEETAREFDLAWQEFKKAEAQTPWVGRRDGDGDGARRGTSPERAWALGG